MTLTEGQEERVSIEELKRKFDSGLLDALFNAAPSEKRIKFLENFLSRLEASGFEIDRESERAQKLQGLGVLGVLINNSLADDDVSQREDFKTVAKKVLIEMFLNDEDAENSNAAGLYTRYGFYSAATKAAGIDANPMKKSHEITRAGRAVLLGNKDESIALLHAVLEGNIPEGSSAEAIYEILKTSALERESSADGSEEAIAVAEDFRATMDELF